METEERLSDTHPVPGRPEPAIADDIAPQLDFLYRATENFERAAQFADAKAGGVMLILSIGLIDLLRNIRQLPRCASHLAGLGLAGDDRLPLRHPLCHRRRRPGAADTRPAPTRRSSLAVLLRVARSYPTPHEYGEAVWRSTEREIFNSMAIAAWNLAGIAGEKFRHLHLAYSAALLFVIGWAFARLGLSLSKYACFPYFDASRGTRAPARRGDGRRDGGEARMDPSPLEGRPAVSAG